MGAVFEEFVKQLAAWETQYAGRPKEHMVRLCLLALEREELVTIAYREEHIAMLLEVPGWRRARLFEQVDGNGPSFCALHELESPQVLQSEAMQKTRTPWRERVIGGVSRDERGLWKLLSRWPHAREVRE